MNLSIKFNQEYYKNNESVIGYLKLEVLRSGSFKSFKINVLGVENIYTFQNINSLETVFCNGKANLFSHEDYKTFEKGIYLYHFRYIPH
jgi:hypothetical protein